MEELEEQEMDMEVKEEVELELEEELEVEERRGGGDVLGSDGTLENFGNHGFRRRTTGQMV